MTEPINSTEQFLSLVNTGSKNLAGQSREYFLEELCKSYLSFRGVVCCARCSNLCHPDKLNGFCDECAEQELKEQESIT